MRGRMVLLGIAAGHLASCGGAPPAPPALAYRLPDVPEASYLVTDTATISMSALGQTMALELGSAANYSMSFRRAGEGLAVTMSMMDLDATLNAPMVGSTKFDESGVTGDLAFTLDRRGNAVIGVTPDVSEPALRFVAPEQAARLFFPALPGTAVAVGDSWSDTVAVESDTEGSQRTVFDYLVVGDTVVAGVSVLHISFEGTSEVTQALSMQGTELELTTSLELDGFVLWDLQRGLLFERATNMSGTGSVQTPMLPARIPTSFEMHSTARLVSE
jgi:hypothetical protein